MKPVSGERWAVAFAASTWAGPVATMTRQRRCTRPAMYCVAFSAVAAPITGTYDTRTAVFFE
jgi:hypothetical protein